MCPRRLLPVVIIRQARGLYALSIGVSTRCSAVRTRQRRTPLTTRAGAAIRRATAASVFLRAVGADVTRLVACVAAPVTRRLVRVLRLLRSATDASSGVSTGDGTRPVRRVRLAHDRRMRLGHPMEHAEHRPRDML